MTLAIKPITGIALGFDIKPVPGVYLSLYLLIFEIALFNEEEMEE